jgi:NADH:ubiquinone oxidoreductase subunit 3 (subunit A)
MQIRLLVIIFFIFQISCDYVFMFPLLVIYKKAGEPTKLM